MNLADILSDQRWRLANIYQIRNAFSQIEPFVQRLPQTWILDRLWWRNVILKARKLGFSTQLVLLGGDRGFFNPGQEMMIIDRTLPDATKKLDMVRLAWSTMGLAAPGLSEPDARELHKKLRSYTGELVTNSKTTLEWENGSRVECSTSSRGGSPNFLLVSEYGYIALKHPDRAAEIMTGAVESVQAGGQNIVSFESTHNGGKFGDHYELIQRAQESHEPLTELDFRFHFFAWWEHPNNRVPLAGPLNLPAEHVAYFNELRTKHGIVLDDEQKLWWSKTKLRLSHAMGREHPSIPSEPFDAPIQGAIYGNILADLRAKGRVNVNFEHDRRLPVWVFWDIGHSDYTAFWAVQLAGQDILWLDWYENHLEPPSHYAEVIREWSNRYPIAGHFLPHDAGNKSFISAGISAEEQLKKCGLTNLTILPRCASRWDGINELKELLPRSTFHARCSIRREVNGEKRPSGIDRLEGYRKHLAEAGEVIKEEPVHDDNSNSSDAARMLAEAYAAGKILTHFPTPRRDRKPMQAILP